MISKYTIHDHFCGMTSPYQIETKVNQNEQCHKTVCTHGCFNTHIENEKV